MTLTNQIRVLFDLPLKAKKLLIKTTEHKITERDVERETEDHYKLVVGFANIGKYIKKDDEAIKEVLY